MDRRSFLRNTSLSAAGLIWAAHPSDRSPSTASMNLQTKHLVFIINGNGARKKDYYEDTLMAPNVTRMAKEGFVFEEDHCDNISSHETALTEMLQGFPRVVRKAYGDEATKYWYLRQSMHAIPSIMQEFKPRILIFHESGHDAGHGAGGHPRQVSGFQEYVRIVRTSDESIGNILTWVKSDPYFSKNTAIVIRPDFGRDDEVNQYGELHHSEGFYYTHRVASIYWGPDFNIGVDKKTIVNRRDIAPTLAKLFNVDLEYSQGQVVPGLFKPTSG